jgi:hypothetical protein
MAYTLVARTPRTRNGTRIDNLTTGTGAAGGAGTGLSFSNDGHQFLHVSNTGVGTPAVVVLASGQFRGAALTTANETRVTVSGEKLIMGPFPPEIFNNSDGEIDVYFTGSDESDLELVWMDAS